MTPIMAMSATFSLCEQERFRTVGILDRMCGSPIHEIINDWESDVMANPNGQSRVYSNSAKLCDEPLLILNQLEA